MATDKTDSTRTPAPEGKSWWVYTFDRHGTQIGSPLEYKYKASAIIRCEEIRKRSPHGDYGVIKLEDGMR